MVKPIVARKAQQLRNTLYVSLPRQWAIDQGVRKGDLLRMSTDDDGRLLINPPEEAIE